VSDIAWNHEIYDVSPIGGSTPTGEPNDRFDVGGFRTMMGGFATGTVAVTYESDGRFYGMTANSFTSVSLDPPLALVSLMRASRALQYLLDRPFAINVLAADQLELALYFAGRPQGQEPRWLTDGPAPRLAGTVASMQCTPWAGYPGGDHVLVLGRVVEFEDSDDVAPLVRQRGLWAELASRSTYREKKA